VEPSSCAYEVNINTPLLCQHPKYFKDDGKEKSEKIFCFEKPLTSEEEIEKRSESILHYSQEKEKKQKIEKEAVLLQGNKKTTAQIKENQKEVPVVSSFGKKGTTTGQEQQKTNGGGVRKEKYKKEKTDSEMSLKELRKEMAEHKHEMKQFDAVAAVLKGEIDKRMKDRELAKNFVQNKKDYDANTDPNKGEAPTFDIEAYLKKYKDLPVVDVVEAWENSKKEGSSTSQLQVILDDPKTSESLKTALTQLIKDLKALDYLKIEYVEIDDDEKDELELEEIDFL
jgi:uncharacterized protein (DUF736 family)